MATMVASAIVRTRVRAPKFALLPAATAPRNALLLSTLLHLAILPVLVWLPILVPAPSMIVTSADLRHEADFLPLFPPVLPPMAEARPIAERQPGSPEEAQSVVETLPGAGRLTSSRPKPDYAGAQEIVSNPPNSTSGVQTILRPDLVAPPKLPYPLRLPSLLVLPTSASPALVAPPLEKPEPSKREEQSTVQASEPPVEVPVGPIDRPKLPVALAEPVVLKTIVSSEPSLQVAAATMDPEAGAAKAVVVINAVSVPPEPVPKIPDAELAARFVVGPSRDATAVETASGAAGANIAGAGTLNAGENLPPASVENGTGTGVEVGDGHAGVASTASPSSVGAGSGSSGATVSASPAADKGLPGISISGGVPGRSGRVVPTSPTPYGSYALTIISGGSSGGASRDLGVFARSETVYTVYIPMTDAGGGPDWPMQYALNSSDPAHNGTPNGLLTPPVVLKKIQATARKTDLTANLGPVFVTGIIDENGKLQALRAIRAQDGRAQPAVDALAQWVFLPAQLDGKPVASKVLIGVSVMPTEEVGKQE